MDIIVEYGMEDGFSGKLIAPDLTEAMKMAKAIYEQIFECDYAKRNKLPIIILYNF